MSKLITVFGATGNQGGSVVKHILADPALSSEFKVRGITRDVSKPAAKSLSDQGVEMKTVRYFRLIDTPDITFGFILLTSNRPT